MAQDGLPTNDTLRELARKIQDEHDPDKMIKLVQQLIAKYDEEKVGIPGQLKETRETSRDRS
jgi:hypothetical protein